MALPDSVDGQHANVTYGNGVLVIALPLSARTTPANLTLETVGPAHGERIGNSGHEYE
ncbi:MAG: Hsp20/alpha crystallin family protein [Chloroflexota bacterium]|nr:Hsp20/alpha crystallin family protein [Chloroflexota bacterium]